MAIESRQDARRVSCWSERYIADRSQGYVTDRSEQYVADRSEGYIAYSLSEGHDANMSIAGNRGQTSGHEMGREHAGGGAEASGGWWGVGRLGFQGVGGLRRKLSITLRCVFEDGAHQVP